MQKPIKLTDFYLHLLGLTGLLLSSVSLYWAGSPRTGFGSLFLILSAVLLKKFLTRNLSLNSQNEFIYGWSITSVLFIGLISAMYTFISENNPSLALNVFCSILLGTSLIPFFQERLYFLAFAYHLIVSAMAFVNWLSPTTAAFVSLISLSLIRFVVFLNRLELQVKER